MKLILQAIKALLRKLEAAVEAMKPYCIQSDWEQNDPENPDYVKGRTHYEEVKQIPIDGMEFVFPLYNNQSEYEHGFDIPLEVGQTWQVYYSRNSSSWLTAPSMTNGLEEVKASEDGTLYLGTDTLNSAVFFVTSTIYKTNSQWKSMSSATQLKIVGVSGTYSETIIHKLDAKYLPESVDSVVLDSNTADSTKKFKITVDDSGTLTATEVTE